jgi:Domain of unknown function (DUF6398)
VADLGELRIPAAMRATTERVIGLTDQVCADLLDEEYAGLARHVVAKLARKRPSPLLGGRAATWAGGVVWALGQVNFLFDRSTEPYVAQDESSMCSRPPVTRSTARRARGTASADRPASIIPVSASATSRARSEYSRP